jgi:hypothetical protein
MQVMFPSFGNLAAAAAMVWLFSQPACADFEEDYELKAWQEMSVQLPAAPRKEALLPFYVSAATNNNFSVDAASLTVGADGVVRYVLVVETAGGARNVSYEGMRCLTRERRIYASGRLDGAWSKSRNNQWEPIHDVAANRQHAALFLEYFCPGGVIVRNSEEALNALRTGIHPENRRQ